MSSSRQLAAIMFTDIVGYTALMGKDEQKAFELLDKNRQIQKPIIEQFNGRWIKELGDGVMASFNTVSDAVNAAIKIQQTCNASNEFQLRIGIHLGEVVFENDDVFGDGVNIASRIQAIANPGSIYISEAVHNSISNKKEFQTKFVKEEKLKNVKEPVKIYQLIAEGVVQHQPNIGQRIKPKSKVLLFFVSLMALLLVGYFMQNLFPTQKNSPEVNTETIGKSIAVLPFVNSSGDSTQEYFSDGMTESIITDLSKIPGLLVIARNSVFQYKGKSVKPGDVGKDLNVRYILEGSLQRSGDILRVNVNLIETQTNKLVWGNKFDHHKMKDIFLVQDSISNHILAALKVAIAKEDSISKPPPTQNLEAYEYYLRGHYFSRKHAAANRDFIDSAVTMYERAISLDPKFALAYAGLAKAAITMFFIYDPITKWESKAFVATEKALNLDPKLADAYVAKANLFWTLPNGFPAEKAIKELKQALRLNPNLVEARETLGSIYFHVGLLDEALHELRIALTLDPASRFAKPRVARIHWFQQKFDSAHAEFSTVTGAGWSREKALVLMVSWRN